MGHAAITDVATGRHIFSELLYREVPLLGEFRFHPDPLIAWARGPVGTAEKWTLRWNGVGFDFAMRDDEKGIAFDLSTHPTKPMVLQGPNGYSRKADSGVASLYYSFTRLATAGKLRMGDRAWTVRGESWMDKEFGSSQLGEDQVGWDWFSLQLRDGRDLMLYLLRRDDGGIDYRGATLVAPGGSARYLMPEEWQVSVTESWTSPETEATYPARWRVELPAENLRLDVVPVLSDQENRSRLPGGVYYWEGAVAVQDSAGELIGRGYVELTGYGEGNRPPV
jgi:predicted secreted hydrolase